MTDHIAHTRRKRQHAVSVKIRRADMKLEPEILRALLIHVEEFATRPHSHLANIEIEGWSQEEIAYHIEVARDGDLIKATLFHIPDGEDEDQTVLEYDVHRLTMKGHDFLGIARSDTLWARAKEKAKSVGATTGDQLIRTAFDIGKDAIAEVLGLRIS